MAAHQQLIFCGTLRARPKGDYSGKPEGEQSAIVKLGQKFVLHEVRVIPYGFDPEIESIAQPFIGATNPAAFKLEVFTDNPRDKKSSRFEQFATLQYDQAKTYRVVAATAQPPASTLVLRGAFDSITICVYGSPVQNVVVPRPGSGYDVSRENKRRREDPVDIRDSKDSKEPEERRDAAKRRSEDSRPSMADQESRDVKRPRSKDEQRAEKDDPVDVDLVPTFPEPGEAAGHKVQQPQLLWSFADVGARIIAGERSVHHMLPIDASILGRQGAAAALRAAGTKLEAFLARPDFSGDAIQTASVRHEWLVAMEETLPSLQYGLCSLSDASMAEAVENRRRLIDWTNAALDLEGAALLGKSMNLRQLRVGVMYAKTIWLTSDSLGDELTKRGVQRRLCNLCGEDFCSTLLSILVIALDASLGTAVGLEHYLGLAVEGANEQQPLPCAAVADMLKTEDRIAPVRLVVAIETITQKAQLYEALVDFQVATDRWTTGNRSPELEEQAVAALEIAGQKLATAHKLWQKEPKQFPNAAEQDKVEIEDHRFTELVTPAFVIAAMSSRRTLHYFALLSTGLVTPLAEQRATKAILSALLYLMRSKAGMLLLGHQSGATKLLFRSFTAGSMSRLDAQLTLDMCMREHASLGASSEDGAHQLAILKLNVGWLLITHVEALDVIIQLTSRSPQRAGRATDDASLLQLLFPTIQNLGQLSMKKQATTWVSVLFGAVPWLIEFLLASGATPSLDGQTDNAKVGGSSGSDAKASESTRSPSQSSKDRGQSKDSDSNRDQAGEEESLLTIARRWAVLLVLAIVQDPRSTQLVAKHGVSLANLKPKLKAINARDPQIMEALSDLQAWMAPVTSLSKQQAELTPLVALSVQIGSCPVKPTINDGGQIPTLLIALRLMCHLVDTHEGTEVFSAMHGMGMSIASSLNFVAKLLDLSIVSKPSNVSPLMFAAVPLLKLARYVIRVSFRSSAAMGNYEFFLEGFFILYHSLEQIAGGAGGADVPSAETSNLKRRATLLLEILRQMYEDALSPSERVVSQGQDFDSQFYQGVVTLPSLEALLKDTVVSASTVTGSFSLLDRCLAPLHQLHGGTAFGDAQKWRADFLRSSVALAGRPLGKMVSAMACCTNPAARNSLRQTIALLCKSDQAIGAQILKVVLKDALAMATRPKAKEEARTDEPDSHQKKTDTGQKASVPKSVSPNMHRSAPPKAELQSMVYTGMEDCAQVVGMTRIENMQLRCYLDLLAIFMDFDFFYADMAAEADDALVLFRELLKSDGNLRILALSMYWKCLTSPVQPAGFGLEAMQAWVLADAFALAAEGRIQTRCWALRLVVRLLEQPAGFKNLLGLLNDKWDLLSDLLMSVLTGFTGSEETDGLAVLNSSMVVLVMHRLLAHHRDEDYTVAAIKNIRNHGALCAAIKKAIEPEDSIKGVFRTLAGVVQDSNAGKAVDVDVANVAAMAAKDYEDMKNFAYDMSSSSGVLGLDAERADAADEHQAATSDVSETLMALWGAFGSQIELPMSSSAETITFDIDQYARQNCPRAIDRRRVNEDLQSRGAKTLSTREQTKRQYKKMETEGLSLDITTFRSAKNAARKDGFRSKSNLHESRVASMHVDDFQRMQVEAAIAKKKATEGKGPKQNVPPPPPPPQGQRREVHMNGGHGHSNRTPTNVHQGGPPRGGSGGCDDRGRPPAGGNFRPPTSGPPPSDYRGPPQENRGRPPDHRGGEPDHGGYGRGGGGRGGHQGGYRGQR